jgi:glycosyltransferase involved in cell wall biosynthesis
MRFSVLIPAYNAAATIRAALDAALSQSVRPHEILVYDDGSSDNTAAVLASYGSRIRAFSGPNCGVAGARNFLCAQVTGDYLAFLDADDIWHSRYLEVQQRLIERYPEAIAYFTGYVDVVGTDVHKWGDDPIKQTAVDELIDPKDFLKRCNRTPMQFNMSWLCMPASAIARLGTRPFYDGGAEDAYLHNVLPLLGPVARTNARVVAYRIIDGSLSSDRVRSSMWVVEALRAVAPKYDGAVPRELSRCFAEVSASRKRDYGKFLMGTGRTKDARRQFIDSLARSAGPASLLKSMFLWALTLMPQALQPSWPTVGRLG